jgi:hypothetical protein
MTLRDSLSTLPFVAGDNLWAPATRNGRDLANACLDFIMARGAPTLLGQVAKAQITAGAYGQTEVQFWQRIAERVLS